MHMCRKCGTELGSKNTDSSYIKKHDYICKKCTAKRFRLQRQNNPEKFRAKQQDYQKNNREKIRQWNNSCYYKHREQRLAYGKNRRKTEKGKLEQIKHFTKRQRELGWILMFENPFDDSVLVDYHHITDVYVVAVPRDLHRLYLGKNHREKVMEIVKQIY